MAELEAAIAGGRTYLAAYALGLGATGLTFFDDDVTAFFSPDAAGKSVMFHMAIGRRGRPSRPSAPKHRVAACVATRRLVASCVAWSGWQGAC